MRAQVLDSMELERERGITIKAQAVRVTWKGHELNLIDTPGHVDFTYEVSRSLQACEGACSSSTRAQGIEAQTVANAYLAIENDLEIVPVVEQDRPAPGGRRRRRARARRARRRHARSRAPRLGEDRGWASRTCSTRSSSASRRRSATRRRPPRALVFDSSYDQYRGVVAFVRVVDGQLPRARERARAMAHGTRFEAEELGFFSPTMTAADDARRRRGRLRRHRPEGRLASCASATR